MGVDVGVVRGRGEGVSRLKELSNFLMVGFSAGLLAAFGGKRRRLAGIEESGTRRDFGGIFDGRKGASNVVFWKCIQF